jgi:glycosyltransferase involved in cell wall biosynthesis
MKIGIDATYIRPGENGGTESYLRNLLAGLDWFDKTNEYFVFTTKQNDHTFIFHNPKFSKIRCDLSGKSRLLRILYVNIFLPFIIKRQKIDVMFFPTYIRCLSKVKGVKVISNLHDLQYKHFPNYFSLGKRLLFDLFYRVSLEKSDSIICISEFVKDDIIRHFPKTTSDKLKTIYNSIMFERSDFVNEVSVNTLRNEREEYILSVATLTPHKNLATLIKAFAILKGEKLVFKLLLVGNKPKTGCDIESLISELRLENDIIITGHISDPELTVLYKQASLYVCTSTFEGFGMPPVEAIGNGIPVVSTKCASLQEVTMNLATYYDDPFDYNELAEKIKYRLENLDDVNLQSACEKVRQKYNIETITRQYIEHFLSVYDF